MNSIKVNYSDFQDLIISQVRYSLGRMTMAPLTTSDIVKFHMKDLSENTIEIIRKDILSRIQDHDKGIISIGWDCDYKTWSNLLKFIDEFKIKKQ